MKHDNGMIEHQKIMLVSHINYIRKTILFRLRTNIFFNISKIVESFPGCFHYVSHTKYSVPKNVANSIPLELKIHCAENRSLN